MAAASGSCTCAPSCPRPGAAIGNGWREVGSFLGPSIRDYYDAGRSSGSSTPGATPGIGEVGAPALARRRGRDLGPEEVRPSFYALRTGGWRDYVTVLHLPYTAWNLAYVALGASLAPVFRTNRMLWTMAAFALALGVSAHALDELNGRPLGTAIPSRMLVALAVAALAGACAIGIWAASNWGWGLLAFVAVGAFLVPAYNLEWFGGGSTTRGGSRSPGARSRS